MEFHTQAKSKLAKRTSHIRLSIIYNVFCRSNACIHSFIQSPIPARVVAPSIDSGQQRRPMQHWQRDLSQLLFAGSMCVRVFLEVVAIVVCCQFGCQQPDVKQYGLGLVLEVDGCGGGRTLPCVVF